MQLLQHGAMLPANRKLPEWRALLKAQAEDA